MQTNQYHSRFTNATWYPIKQDVIVGGVGGIGSWVTFFLSRVGFPEIHIYDDDIIEVHNISGQFFNKQSVNQSKVDAIADIVEKFTDGSTVYVNEEKYTEESPVTNIMIAAFDNMPARRLMFEKWRDRMLSTTEPCVFIDGRLTAENYQIFVVTKDNYQIYDTDTYLFGEGEAVPAVCNFKQTTHYAAMIGANITALLTNWLSLQSGSFAKVHDLTQFTGKMNKHERSSIV